MAPEELDSPSDHYPPAEGTNFDRGGIAPWRLVPLTLLGLRNRQLSVRHNERMVPFTIRARLSSPVIRQGFLTLDALLMSVLGRGDVSDLLMCEADLYFASAGTVAVGAAQQTASFVASMRPEHTPGWLDVVTPNTANADLGFAEGAKGRARLNDLRIGLSRQREGGNVINAYRAVSGAEIEWYATGIPEEVLAALKEVPFIGKRRTAGYGEVMHWDVQPGELDGVSGYLDEPLRPIPVDRWKLGGDWIPVEAAWKAPYWDVRNRTKCFVPFIT